MSPLHVLVEPGTLTDGATLELDAAELHHVRVRRIDAGDDVVACDGVGGHAAGRLVRDGAGLAVAVGPVERAVRPAETILAVGAGDKDRFVALAERCTEVGVTRLVPLFTERSQTVGTRVREGSLERARRRSREACKQSGNPWATVVGSPVTLAALAELDVACWLMGDAGGGSCPPIGERESVGWIIGPEGGLTATELEFCRHGLHAVPASFGAALLRFDTAALAAAILTTDRRRAATRG